jgi:hypothetical protein
MQNNAPLSCCVFFVTLISAIASSLQAETSPVFEIERVNLTSTGAEFTENFSLGYPSISADGRYVIFTSNNALVPSDTNNRLDVYLRDRVSDTTSLVSLTSTGAIATGGDCYNAKISADGTCVAFVSNATNLVPEKTGFLRDVYVRNLIAGTTTRVSVATGNIQGNADSGFNSISRGDLSLSDDGHYVAFRSAATNLVSGDTNGTIDVFRHDLQTGTTIRVSLTGGGAQAGYDCDSPAISGDGTKVAFISSQDFGGNAANAAQIWLRDIGGATTELISKANNGTAGNSASSSPDLSFDGRYVVYETFSTNLLTIPSSSQNVIVRDRQSAETILVSLAATGSAVNGVVPSISANGRYVTFGSVSNQLALGDSTIPDVFIRDLQSGRTGVASRTSQFLLPNLYSNIAAIADNTLEVAFVSGATNLIPGDTNEADDLFVATPAFPSEVLINELDAITGNGRPFIELYDGGSGATNLSGLVIVLYDGTNDTSYAAFDLDGYTTDSNGYFVIGTSTVPGVDLVAADNFLQSGVDAVALYYDNASNFTNGTSVTTNRLLDAVVHENGQPNDSGLLALLLNSSQPQADEAANSRATTDSVQRLPNGAGYPGITDVFRAYPPSPAAPNGAPSALDLDLSSDSGRSGTDDITSDSTPTISGLAPAGANVVLSSDLAGVVGSNTASGSGAWSITPSVALSAGVHQFTATADGGPASAPLSVTIDTTAPASPTSLSLDPASDTGGSNSDRVTTDNTPTISGEAEALAIVTLASNLDGTVGTTGANSPWSLTATTLQNGTHQVTAMATDTAGNASTASAALTITIDTANPTVTVNQAVGQADPASSAPVEFTVTFNESVSGLVAGDFLISGSAGPASPTISGGTSSYTLTVGSVTGEGTVSLSLPAGAAADLAGNTSDASTGADGTVEIDQHGSTISSATGVILTGGTGLSTGYLGSGDTDYFSFTLTDAKRVLIRTGHGVDTLGALRNAAGDLLNDPVSEDNAGTGSNFQIDQALAPGTYYVEVTGTGTAPTGDYQVDIDATLDPVFRPDTLAGRTLATAIGNNLYGAGQTLLITTRRAAPVNGIFAIGNDGDLADACLLSGGRGNSLFSVSYTHAVAGNITAAIQAGTATTGIIAPGGSPYLVNVSIVPNKKKLVVKKRVKGRLVTQYLKKTFTLPLQARSQANPLVSDTATIQVKTL